MASISRVNCHLFAELQSVDLLRDAIQRNCQETVLRILRFGIEPPLDCLFLVIQHDRSEILQLLTQHFPIQVQRQQILLLQCAANLNSLKCVEVILEFASKDCIQSVLNRLPQEEGKRTELETLLQNALD